MKKVSIIILIVILAILAYSLIEVLIMSIQHKDEDIWFGGSMGEKNIFEEKSYDIAEIENLKLDFKSSNIKLILTDEEQIRVVQYVSNKNKNKNILMSQRNGNTLEISENVKKGIYLFYWNNVNYDIYLPKSYSKNLELIDVSGDVEVDELEMQNIKINLSSGDIKIAKNLKANEIDIVTISGDMNIQNISSEKVKIESTSGDIDIGKITGDIKLKTISGEILARKLSGNINLETTSGDIEINEFMIYGNSTVNSISGDIDIRFSEGSDCVINTKTVSGDIEFPNGRNVLGTGNENKIDIETVSGDIELR